MADSDLRKLGIDPNKLPHHIAIIMDGNGRWAKERRKPRIYGHRAGMDSVRDVVRACADIGIGYLTLYTFSVENWKRPTEEVNALMMMLVELLRDEVEELNENNVKILVIGRPEDLPSNVQEELQKAIQITCKNTGLKLVVALSYGGRTELVDAARKISREISNGKILEDQLTEEIFRNYLYNPGIPDPDLLIRTSGEMRISNFLLWQLAYTEIWITDVFWPGFRRENLYQALLDYQKRDRRFGGVE
jgi:undecaprenyl diphosphate synthase